MEYGCHWCQKEFSDDRGITKGHDGKSELNEIQRKDKGGDDMAWHRWWFGMNLKSLLYYDITLDKYGKMVKIGKLTKYGLN